MGWNRRQMWILLGWQLASLLLTATGYCSQRLATLGVDAPTSQSLFVYMLLTFHFIPLRRQRRAAVAADVEAAGGGGRAEPALRWWQWLLLAAADVEANYLLVMAYQYTDILSVCILDAFSVPAALVFSYHLLGTRYPSRQLLAAAMSLGGACSST